MGATLEPPGEREICASDRSQSGSTGSRAGACPRRLERATSVGGWKISDGCNGEFPLRWSMEGVGAARRCARLMYNTKDNCGIIPRSQGARPAEMSVKSASRRRELTGSSATQFRSRFSSAKSDAYKVHALVRIGSPGYYFPMCENPRHSRGLGWRAPVSDRQFLAFRS